jgi:predicted aminopeptidase
MAFVRESPFPRQLLRIVGLMVLASATSGCVSVRYYAQAIHGEYQILAHRQPIDKLIADPRTPSNLRGQLQLVQELRTFAGSQLKLPVGDSYNKYVDVHRKYVVWDVQAAPQFSLQPKTWWYPFLGRLAYRGYFSEKSARHYGDRLAKKGFDVYVDGVEAYSTLGWFKDPLLNTFIENNQADLSETLFHELAHRAIFVNGDTDFNEAFATTVGQEGARRWLKSRGEAEALPQYEEELVRDKQFVRVVLNTRERLENLYRGAAPRDELPREKQQMFDDLRQRYAEMKTAWGGYSGYDEWFAHDLNNAKLNTIANYYDYVPGFQKLLQLNGGDMEKFYDAVRRLAKETKEQRHQELRELPQD